jgi:hypothetical protein
MTFIYHSITTTFAVRRKGLEELNQEKKKKLTMLQTRFENEQFNSLSNIFTINQSPNDYITTDRPDSSKVIRKKNTSFLSFFLFLILNSLLIYIYILFRKLYGEMFNIQPKMKL